MEYCTMFYRYFTTQQSMHYVGNLAKGIYIADVHINGTISKQKLVIQ